MFSDEYYNDIAQEFKDLREKMTQLITSSVNAERGSKAVEVEIAAFAQQWYDLRTSFESYMCNSGQTLRRRFLADPAEMMNLCTSFALDHQQLEDWLRWIADSSID